MSHSDSCQLSLIWLANVTLNDARGSSAINSISYMHLHWTRNLSHCFERRTLFCPVIYILPSRLKSPPPRPPHVYSCEESSVSSGHKAFCNRPYLNEGTSNCDLFKLTRIFFSKDYVKSSFVLEQPIRVEC